MTCEDEAAEADHPDLVDQVAQQPDSQAIDDQFLALAVLLVHPPAADEGQEVGDQADHQPQQGDQEMPGRAVPVATPRTVTAEPIARTNGMLKM